MRVLVTGATGFIGRHLCRALASAGDVPIEPNGAAIGGNRGRRGDVRLQETWRSVAETEAVVHLAGLSDASLSGEQPVEYNTVNALGTLLGLEAARRHDKLFVLASSQRVYRPQRATASEEAALQPVDPYGYSKMAAERWVEMYRRVFGLRTVVVRFFSVFGPGQSVGRGTSGVVSIFTTRALQGQDLIVHGRAWRDFTYVTDVVKGITLALANPAAVGQTYNIATGVGTSTAELAEAVLRACGSRSKIALAEPEKEGESYVADISKARAQLGYQPEVTLRAGLERYAAALRG